MFLTFECLSSRRTKSNSYFKNKHLRRATMRSLPNPMGSQLPGCRRLLAASTLLLILLLNHFDAALSLEQQVVAEQQEQQEASSQHQQQVLGLLQPAANHQEILVQPNAAVRIECKLPQAATSEAERYYLWNFRQSATGAAKPHTLCYETKCQGARSFGFYLDSNLNKNGNYDLINNNVTYELNDGFYYCDYSDSNPESRITREYRLTVLIPPQAPTIVSSSSGPAREGQEYQLSCLSSGGNPEPNITWFRNNQLLAPAGIPGIRIEQTRSNGTTSSQLSLIPSLEDHQAIYKCQVWNKAMVGLAPYEQEHRLYVEFAPRISFGQVNPLRVLQGSQVSLSCLVEANPGVKSVKWFKDGHLISNQFNHTIHEAKISDSSVYTCQAENGIAPLTPTSFASGGSSSASAAASSSIGAFFGSLLSAGATSGADRNPGYVEAQLQVQVLYPPSVHVRGSRGGAVKPGESFQLSCQVDANPQPYEFLWTKQEEPSFRKSSAQLEFPAPSASDAGNYTCTVFTRLEPYNLAQPIERQASGSYQLNVIHPPGVAEIVLGSNGEAELGSRAQIQCRAKPPGFPEPKYTFWKGNNKLQLSKVHGPTFTIQSVSSNDEGRYFCLAQNEHGSSTEAEGELVVNEPPKVIEDSTRGKSDVRQQGESPFSITFRAQAKPEPRVSWFQRSPVDGRRVELSSLEMQYKFHIETSSKQDQAPGGLRPRYNVVTTLTFRQPLELDDRGLYSVEFSNGLSRSATQSFQLHINHTPIPAPKGFPISSQLLLQAGGSLAAKSVSRLKAGFELGESVSLVCRVSAWPKPEFEWSGESSDGYKPISTNPRYKSSVENVHDDVWESTLSFSQAQESDYGEYLCASANTDTRTNKMSENLNTIIKLSPKSTPDPPMLLEPVDSTQDSITLQWVPGFDGGYPQNQFLVQYALEDAAGLSIGARYPAADGQGALAMASAGGYGHSANMLDSIDLLQQQQSSWPKAFDCQSANPCTIGQLLPRQAYVFRVRAKNLLGSSVFSEEARAMTRANLSVIPKIASAFFDLKNNQLQFKIEAGSDYLLNNLNARIDFRTADSLSHGAQDSSVQEISLQAAAAAAGPGNGWRSLPSLGPLRHEKVEAYLAVPADAEELRITLCSRSNESLCGPEYVFNANAATSSFLQAQAGLSYSILFSSLTLIILLSAFASSLGSCCAARNKAEAIDDHQRDIDNKPIGNNHHAGNKSSHTGSTTSTNSTSAGGNGTSATSNGLQSMDSINANLLGATSDHSSDHSRQAKLDSMLPPNYNHYADRATLLMEQQQQQQLLQQQGLLADKLSSPFANNFLNGALMSQQQQQMPSPMVGGAGQFGYGQQPMSLEAPMDANMMLAANADPNQQVLGWPANQQMLDEYSYNALANAGGLYGSAPGAENQLEQMMEPAYGTSGQTYGQAGQEAAGHFQAYFEQQQHYQQDIAQAQQQMYGTLQSNAAAYNSAGNSPNDFIDNHSSTQNNLTNQQLMEQQYSTNGLMAPPAQLALPPPQLPLPPPLPPGAGNGQQAQQQESDYGTVGRSRSGGRFIREIIV